MTNEGPQAKHSADKPTARGGISDILARIKNRDEEAIAELFGMVSSGLMLLIRRRLGPAGAEGRVRETFQAVVEGIQSDGLSDPDGLTAFVRETLQRQFASRSQAAPAPGETSRQSPNSVVAMREVLESLPEHERDALTRFYVLEQPAEQIMSEVGMSAADFRAMKARAKMRFLELRESAPSEHAK